MKYTESKIGRIFIIKLEDGDKLPNTLEDFAMNKNIKSGLVFYIGGAKKSSKVIVGPLKNKMKKIIPRIKKLKRISEAIGIGTFFLNEKKEPKLHMHSSFGGKNTTITGCIRKGIDIWLIGEVIIIEIIDNNSLRKLDKNTGFELLDP